MLYPDDASTGNSNGARPVLRGAAAAAARQYEALRAYFAEGMPSAEAARRFGYTPGAFRVLCHAFRHGRVRDFFVDAPRGPQVQTKKDPARPLIVALRKQNLSIYLSLRM